MSRTGRSVSDVLWAARNAPLPHVRISREGLPGKRPKPPTSSSPAVNELFRIIAQSGRLDKDLLARLGLGPTSSSLTAWRYGHALPNLSNFEALAAIMGYRVRLEKIL